MRVNTLGEYTPCITAVQQTRRLYTIRYTHLSRDNEFCARVVHYYNIYTETGPPPESETNITVCRPFCG